MDPGIGPGYLLTGYAYDNMGNHYTYVMEIDAAGNINWTRQYYGASSVGLNLIECSDGTGYVVAGYIADNPGSNSPNRSGYLMKIDPAGAVLWDVLYDSPKSGQDFDMAEQVIEIPGAVVQSCTTNMAFYVTGSVNLVDGSWHYQKVLSMVVDDNGTVMWQQSFSTGNPPSSYMSNAEVGVSSIYEPNQNWIYHVSNAEMVHGFIISIIDPANGTVIQRKYIADSTLSTACKLSAYQVLDKNADSVTVVGFIHDYDWSSSNPQNPTFAIDIEKSSLLPGTVHVFRIPSNGHNAFFTDWLGTPATTGFPIIHTADMAYMENGYIWLACYYKQMPTSDYDLALMRIVHANYTEACDPVISGPQHADLNYIDIPLVFRSAGIDLPVTFSESTPNYTEDSCSSGGSVPSNKPGALSVLEMGTSHGLAVYPSPASNTLHVSLQGADIQGIKVYDITGKELSVTELKHGVLNIATFQPGMYLIKVIAVDNSVYTQRFIKE
ncbi:MAG: T9SS type A sorting domain-containing protein [Candidatus Kuenenia stuttgartiensis]|nr:T9SS type A sorting domain-containing protein [Candidatus Kuenenia stuttgartiensis]